MRELREIRVYLLMNGIIACLTKIGLFLWAYYGLGDWFAHDGVSILARDIADSPFWSFWW